MANINKIRLSGTTYDIQDINVSAHTANTDVHVTVADKAVWNAKADSSAVTEEISAAVSGKVDTEDLDISGKTIYGVVSSIIQDDVSSKQYKSFILRLTSKRNINQRTLVSFDVYSNGSSVTTLSLYAVVSATDGFTSAYLSNTTYANVAIVDDGIGLLVTFADGYYLGTYTRISSYINNFQMEFPSIVITSGSTPAVVEQGVYDALETINDAILVDEKNIETLSAKTLNALTGASIDYLDNNIRLSKRNVSGASSTSNIAVDNSLSYHKKLGVYATGATHTISLNDNYRSESNFTVGNYSGVVKMYINQSYTGTTPTTRALHFNTNSEGGLYTYDSGTDEFTPDGTYTTVAFAYDKTNHLVTFTTLNDATFSAVGSSGYIAPSTALTQDNCFIGLVTIDTTSYKLQEALDNKQDQLVAGENITISGNVISATGGGGGGVTIDQTLDSGSTNPVANSAITEAVLVPSYRGLIEVQYDIAFPNATALYVENVTSGAYQDATMIEFYLSGVSEVSENILVTSFSGHTLSSEPSYMDYEWTEDNSLIFTPKTSGNYFYKIHNGWDTGFGVYVIDDYSSGSSSSVIQNEIYPRITNLAERIDSFTDTKVTGTSYNNIYIDYGGYWYHEIEIFDNASGRFTASDQLRYNDFGYDNGVITVKKTSGATSGSTDCITSGGVYAKMGGMTIVKITESEYAALETKDESTLYVVIPDPTNP